MLGLPAGAPVFHYTPLNRKGSAIRIVNIRA